VLNVKGNVDCECRTVQVTACRFDRPPPQQIKRTHTQQTSSCRFLVRAIRLPGTSIGAWVGEAVPTAPLPLSLAHSPRATLLSLCTVPVQCAPQICCVHQSITRSKDSADRDESGPSESSRARYW
jgi:hypothetical protein